LTIGTVGPPVRAGPGTLQVTDVGVFGQGSEARARRFARRVLSLAEVQSLALDPSKAMATLIYRLTNGVPVPCSAVSRAQSRILMQG
jgi:hypothetical protein